MSDGTTRKSTTRASLLRMATILLAATVVMGIATTLSMYGQYRTAETVRERSMPAIMGVTDTRESIVIAHQEAIVSFQTGEVRLSGPGVRYQDEIANAGRSLTRVAEDNVAGDGGSQQIQLVQGLLLAYLDLIGQADAHYRGDGGTRLGLVYLWHAWQLLDEELLPALEELRDVEQKAFDDQRSGWALAVRVAVGAVPILTLLILLPTGQRYLRHRFRRILSLPLLAATALLIALASAAAVSTIVVTARLDAVNRSLAQVQEDRERSAPAARGERTVLALLGCGAPHERCGETVRRSYEEREPPTGLDGSDPDRQDASGETENRDWLASTAVSFSYVWLASPLVAVAIGALIAQGLAPRLEEYRYRYR